MHAKLTIADDTVFLGSFNLSRSGEMNAENVLEIADAALADRLAAFVDELRARYPARQPSRLTSAALGGVSDSHATAWPSPADLSTFSVSSAHFMRVAEMSIPSRSSTKSRSSRIRSSTGMPTSSSDAIDADACEIAQPWPEKRTSAMRPSSPTLELDLQLVAAERVVVLELEVGIGQLAEVPRLLVVLEDVLAVEVVHRLGEDLLHRAEPGDQAVDVVVRRVHGERRARRRRDAEALHQHLRAVVAGAHADALAAEDLGDVVRVDAVERERDRRCRGARGRTGRGSRGRRSRRSRSSA